MALPHDGVALRDAKATARTQDIPIDSHALPTARALFMAGAANPLGAMATTRTAADNAAIDELAYATSALNYSAGSAPSAQRDSVSSGGSNGGSSSNRTRRRGSASEGGFAGGGMSGGGAWGGATGSPARQNTSAPRVANSQQVKAQATRPTRPTPEPRQARGASPSTPSAGDSSGRASQPADAGTFAAPTSTFASAAPVATVAAVTPTTAPVFTTGNPTTNGGIAHVTKTSGGGSSPSPAPEPISLLLMGTGLAGAYAGRRFVR